MTSASDFAVDIESKELKLFSEMADKAKDPGVRRIFKEMVKDEMQTISQFSSLCNTSDEDPACMLTNELKRPGQLHLDHINPKEELANIHDDIDAYKFVMKVDEEVEDIYQKAVDKVKDRTVRLAMNHIIDIKDKEAREVEEAYLFANAPNEHLEWAEFSNIDEFHQFGREIG